MQWCYSNVFSELISCLSFFVVLLLRLWLLSGIVTLVLENRELVGLPHISLRHVCCLSWFLSVNVALTVHLNWFIFVKLTECPAKSYSSQQSLTSDLRGSFTRAKLEYALYTTPHPLTPSPRLPKHSPCLGVFVCLFLLLFFFLLITPRHFLCCSSSLFLRGWFHVSFLLSLCS